MYKKIIKKLCITFNKDYWNDINNMNNIYVLNNDYYEDNNIHITSYMQSINYYYKNNYEDSNIMLEELNKLNKINKNKMNILLVHSPICLNDDNIKEVIKKYDLVLSGHMHNGLVIPYLDEKIKGNTGFISPNKSLFPKMSRGYIKGNNLIIISSGINKIHTKKLFFMNPLNLLFSIGYSIIDIKNKKCKFTTSYKYTK